MKSLEELIKKYISENPVKSKRMAVFPNITEDWLKAHICTFEKGEIPLIVVNKRRLATGIVITNKKIHYTCIKDEYFARMFGILFGASKGSINIVGAKSMQIGDYAWGYGPSYIGNKLMINGNCVGIVRMGDGIQICADENIITYLNSLFDYLADNSVISEHVKEEGIDMENQNDTPNQSSQTQMAGDMQSMTIQQMMQQQIMQQNMLNQQMMNQMKEMNNSDKSRFVYIILALFLGVLGIHNFYARRVGLGFLQLLLSLTYVGLIITIPWCILEIIFVKRDGDGKKMK